MDLANNVKAVVNIGGVEVWITETLVNTWIIMGMLFVLAIAVRIALTRFKAVPAGFQNVVELAVEKFDSFLRSCVSEKLMFVGNWYFTVFAFIILSNLSGLFGLRPPTADWVTTFMFALSTFVMIQVCGIKVRKGRYLKSFFSPHPLFFPLNLIGELARPISLSFRLFGNVLGGMILVTIVYSFAPVRFGIPIILHGFFDLFSGALQTYIFCVLSLTFIGQAAED